MAKKPIPKFTVKNERNDVGTQVRVQQLENGFVVRTGNKPIHYTTIEEAADAVRAGLVAAPWYKGEK